MLNMPRERMECGISVWTQCVLKMCRVANSVSHVSEADTEQDQSVYVMIVSLRVVAFPLLFFLFFSAHLYSFVHFFCEFIY